VSDANGERPVLDRRCPLVGEGLTAEVDLPGQRYGPVGRGLAGHRRAGDDAEHGPLAAVGRVHGAVVCGAVSVALVEGSVQRVLAEFLAAVYLLRHDVRRPTVEALVPLGPVRAGDELLVVRPSVPVRVRLPAREGVVQPVSVPGAEHVSLVLGQPPLLGVRTDPRRRPVRFVADGEVGGERGRQPRPEPPDEDDQRDQQARGPAVDCVEVERPPHPVAADRSRPALAAGQLRPVVPVAAEDRRSPGEVDDAREVDEAEAGDDGDGHRQRAGETDLQDAQDQQHRDVRRRREPLGPVARDGGPTPPRRVRQREEQRESEVEYRRGRSAEVGVEQRPGLDDVALARLQHESFDLLSELRPELGELRPHGGEDGRPRRDEAGAGRLPRQIGAVAGLADQRDCEAPDQQERRRQHDVLGLPPPRGVCAPDCEGGEDEPP